MNKLQRWITQRHKEPEGCVYRLKKNRVFSLFFRKFTLILEALLQSWAHLIAVWASWFRYVVEEWVRRPLKRRAKSDNGRMGRTLCLHKNNKDIQWHIHVWYQHLANNYNLLASFFILFACLTLFSFFRFWRRNLRCQKQRLFQAYLTMPLFRFWDKPSFCTSTADQLFLQPTEAVGNSLKLLIEARTTASCSAVHCSSQLNSCQSQLGTKWKHLYHQV